MTIILIFSCLWFFSIKGYYAFKFAAVERGGNERCVTFGSYFGKQRISSSDFGFIFRKAATAEGEKLKKKANFFLLLFYLSILSLMSFEFIAELLHQHLSRENNLREKLFLQKEFPGVLSGVFFINYANLDIPKTETFQEIFNPTTKEVEDVARTMANR